MFFGDIVFCACCVSVCLMTAEIIVCEMLIKSIKLRICDFPVIYFWFSELIMVKYCDGICLWFFCGIYLTVKMDLFYKMFNALTIQIGPHGHVLSR